MDNIRNALADLAHQQWSGWMRYLFKKGTFNDDGTWTMPKWAVDRWTKQMVTTFQHLSGDEQKSDYQEAERVLMVIEEIRKRDK